MCGASQSLPSGLLLSNMIVAECPMKGCIHHKLCAQCLSLPWVCGLWFCSDIKLNAMSICMKACNSAFNCCTTMPSPGIDEHPAKQCTYVTALYIAQSTQLVIYVCTPCDEHIERQNSFLPAKVSISLLCLNNNFFTAGSRFCLLCALVYCA